MSDTADLISVIVTNYNHAKYLGQRMESLSRQTYPNLEIIVVDNCSTDNSLEVLSRYKSDPRVKIVALGKNVGNINSSNMGVSLSRGKYFIFAEADDHNDPAQIELLHKAMEGNEQIAAAFCRSYMVDSEGKIFDEDFNHRDRSFREACSKDTIIPGRSAQRFLLYSCIIPNFSAVLFRREYFDLAGGLTHRYQTCADWDFWFRMAQKGDLYYLSTPLNYFRRHRASAGTLLGVELTVIEIMKMLYQESRNVDLTVWEKFRFKVNVGVIWGRYRKPDPGLWWKSFPSIWRQSLSYDKFSLVYLILAFIKRGTERMIGRA